jgi:hypothetical protein
MLLELFGVRGENPEVWDVSGEEDTGWKTNEPEMAVSISQIGTCMSRSRRGSSSVGIIGGGDLSETLACEQSYISARSHNSHLSPNLASENSLSHSTNAVTLASVPGSSQGRAASRPVGFPQPVSGPIVPAAFHCPPSFPSRSGA